jgi:hypothetical protein
LSVPIYCYECEACGSAREEMFHRAAPPASVACRACGRRAGRSYAAEWGGLTARNPAANESALSELATIGPAASKPAANGSATSDPAVNNLAASGSAASGSPKTARRAACGEIRSLSAGVMPHQAAAATRACSRRGLDGVRFDPASGEAIFRDRPSRLRALKAMGLFDKNEIRG